MKKKPVVVEYRYIGNHPIWETLYSREWKRWSSHKNEKSARKSVEAHTRKYDFLEFRIKESAVFPCASPPPI